MAFYTLYRFSWPRPGFVECSEKVIPNAATKFTDHLTMEQSRLENFRGPADCWDFGSKKLITKSGTGEDFKFYEQEGRHGVQKRLPQLNEVEEKYECLRESGNEFGIFEANCLMDVYAKSGRMRDARRVFDSMAIRNVVSWNVMILGYAKKEEGVLALELYAQMQQEGVEPSSRTFVGALKACSSLAAREEGMDGTSVKMQCLKKGRAIHALAKTSGLDLNIYVGNSLIDMYAKCKSMVEARHVFDRLSHRSLVSWNAMILGYVENEQSEVALQLFERMEEEGVLPDERAFVGALKACSRIREGTEVNGIFYGLETGRRIHSQIVNRSFESDAFVGNTLISMYATCKSMVDARDVFERLPCRDVVSWTAIIMGYAEKHEGEVALQLYARMEVEGVDPNARTFVGALKACASLAGREEWTGAHGKLVKRECLEKGRAIHSQVWKKDLQSNAFVRMALIDMYAKCGSMVDAQLVFDEFHCSHVESWNAVILGYANSHEGEMALRLYEQMQAEGIVANDRTILGALKACRSLAAREEATEVNGKFVKMQSLHRGRALHFKSVEKGFQLNAYVGSILIDIYVKCGSIVDARCVFDNLPHRTVISWNTMILGYAEDGQGEMALQLYARMEQEGVAPTDRTFIGACKACSSLAALEEKTEVAGRFVKIRCLERGRAIHSEIGKTEFVSNTFVANTMIDMYAKCGSMLDAQEVFDNLAHRDAVSWTAMVLGYAENQEGEVALEFYSRMQEEGVAPDDRTFVGALKACGSMAALEEGTDIDGKCMKIRCLERGRILHSQVAMSGFESDVFVGTTLVDMYAKCGNMAEARRAFDRLPHRNVVSWTATISGYAENHEGELALQLYSQMRREGVVPNDRTVVGALKACSSLAVMEEGTDVKGKLVKKWSLEKGKLIHLQALDRRFESNVFVGNTLIDMYAKCGSLEDAQDVFDKLRHRDVVSWNAMMSGYTQNQQSEVGLHLYVRMQQEGMRPDDRTFVCALKACASLATSEEGKKKWCLEQGRAIHNQVVNSGLESDMFIRSTLIDMYAKCGSMEDAWLVFDKLPKHDLVSWNVMILGHAEKEEGEAALQLYARMQDEGVVPDYRSFVGALKACSTLAALEKGKQVDGKFVKRRCLEKGRSIHFQIVKSGLESDVFVGTALVDMYANCGSVMDARHVFDRLPHHDLVSWTAMISGYAELGESEEAFKLYAQMQEEGLAPDIGTFVSVLKACGNTAALETGRKIHGQICRVGVETRSKMAATLIDMYGKCGSMVDAQQVFDALPTRDLVIWNAFIAGYARQGESKVVFRLLDRMKQEGIHPDGVTFLSVLTVCSHVGLVEYGQKYFDAMSKDDDINCAMEHYNCMLDLLGRAGQVHQAMTMVEKMPFKPNIVGWRTLLGACRKWSYVDMGRHSFDCAMRLDEKDAAAYVLMSNIYANAHMWEDRDKIEARRKKALAWKRQPGRSWWTDTSGIVHTFVVGDIQHPQSQDINAKLKDLYAKMKDQGYSPHLDSVLWDMTDAEKEDALCGHTEKLAIAFALLNSSPETDIRIVKNLRICDDCHSATAFISKIERRNIICRDSSRFHNFKAGMCSCGDYW